MTDAYQKADQTVKKYERQFRAWIKENTSDQGDLIQLYKDLEELETKIEAKKAEITGENRVQIDQYTKLISEAKASRDKLLA